MSVIVSGPRRIYLALFFCERLTRPAAAWPRALSRIGQAMGCEASTITARRDDPACRQLLAVQLQRVLWRRLIGLRLLVLDMSPPASSGNEARV